MALNRLRLPGASVLPVAGAVVGLYAGLAAGVFTNLIGVVSGGVVGWPQVLSVVRPGSETRHALSAALLHLGVEGQEARLERLAVDTTRSRPERWTAVSLLFSASTARAADGWPGDCYR